MRYSKIQNIYDVFILIAVFICMSFVAAGQGHVLMLQKRNHHKNAYYKVGDKLTFYREGKKEKITAEIVAIDDSTLTFQGYKVKLSQITALHIDEKTRWWLRFKAAQILLIGGAGYLALDALNRKEFDPQTLAISGSMIGAGIICKLLFPNKINLNWKTRLRIIRV